jgi:hypothetical protein
MRQKSIIIDRDGRDKGGVFLIQEKPAFQATEMFLKAMQLLVRAGVEVPPNIMLHGPAGFVTMGVGSILTGLGKAPYHEVKPLLEELFSCVISYQPPGATVAHTKIDIIKSQIAEPTTIFQIYEEVVSLHLGFSILAKLSYYRTLVTQTMEKYGLNTPTQQNISESPSATN